MSVETGLVVVEGRWESKGNYGVRPMFEMISSLTTKSLNPHSIRHDMFYEATSLEVVLKDIAKSKRIDAVYIGAHGRRGKINGISTETLANILHRVNPSGSISGLYIATCEFAQPAAVAALLDPNRSTGLQWVAGFRKDVEWLESAAADILFWSGYIQSDGQRPLTKAKRGAENLLEYMPKVADQLGFGIFKWSKSSGASVNLVDS